MLILNINKTINFSPNHRGFVSNSTHSRS